MLQDSQHSGDVKVISSMHQNVIRYMRQLIYIMGITTARSLQLEFSHFGYIPSLWKCWKTTTAGSHGPGRVVARKWLYMEHLQALLEKAETVGDTVLRHITKCW